MLFEINDTVVFRLMDLNVGKEAVLQSSGVVRTALGANKLFVCRQAPS